MFANRREAGELLFKELLPYKNNRDAILVALPRGGVPVACILSEKLNLPLEIVLSKKIGHPENREFAIGAVTLNSKIVEPWALEEVSSTYLNQEIERIRALLKKRLQWYYGAQAPIDLRNKTVIVVDDGVATGNTLISSIQLIEQQQPREIIVALPVAPPSAIRKIKLFTPVEKVLCLEVPLHFQSVGQFYEDFGEVTDQEVIRLLTKARERHGLKLSHHSVER